MVDSNLMQKNLIITSIVSELPKVKGEIYEYRIDGGRILSKATSVINNAVRLQQIAELMAETYCDGIADVHDTAVWKDAVDPTIGSLFYLSDVSAKRTEFLESFDALCSAVLLRECFSKKDVNRVIVLGECFLKKDTLSSLFPCATVTFACHRSNFSRVIRPLILNICFFTKLFTLSTFAWLFFKRNEEQRSGTRYFVSRFPGRLNTDRQEQKYGHLVRDNDWYIAGLLTDGLHQNLSLFSWLKHAVSVKKIKNTIVIDSFQRPMDAIEGFLWFLKLYKKALSENLELQIDRIDFGLILKDEILASLVRTPRLLSLSRSFNRLFSWITPSVTKTSIVYYLHEYPFGRMLSSLLASKYVNLRSIGMQHGPSSETKMVYRVAQKDIKRHSNPIVLPDAVLAEDFKSKALYRQNGYSKVIVMKRPPRLGPANTRKYSRVGDENSYHLIATGLHDSSVIVALMVPRMLQNQSQRFLIKFHPKANLKRVNTETLPPNCSIVEQPIDELLPVVSKVLVSYSSVGLEARSKGIEVEFLSIPGRVSQL